MRVNVYTSLYLKNVHVIDASAICIPVFVCLASLEVIKNKYFLLVTFDLLLVK